MTEAIPLPAPIDVRQLDPTEASLAGGLLLGRSDVVSATVALLKPEDFTHAGLVAVVRAVDQTVRAARTVNVPKVSATAVERGVIHAKHRSVFDALLLDLLAADVTMGEPALWYAPLLIDRSVRRAVAGLGVRVGQSVDEVSDPGQLSPTLRTLALDLTAAADRLDQEVIA